MLVPGTQPGFGRQSNCFALHFHDIPAVSPAPLHTHTQGNLTPESWVIHAIAGGDKHMISFGPRLSCSKRFEANTRGKADDAVYLLACPSQRYHTEQAVVEEQQVAVRHCAGPNGVSVPSRSIKALTSTVSQLCSPGDPHLPFAVETGSSGCNLQKCISLSDNSSVMWMLRFAV